MGSFSVSCRISGIGIADGEDVVILLLEETKRGYDGAVCYNVMAPPIFGFYDDYGRARGNTDDTYLGRKVIEYWEDILGPIQKKAAGNRYEDIFHHKFEKEYKIKLPAPYFSSTSKVEVGFVHRRVWDALAASVFTDMDYSGEAPKKFETSMARFEEQLPEYVRKHVDMIVLLRARVQARILSKKKGEEAPDAIMEKIKASDIPFMGGFCEPELLKEMNWAEQELKRVMMPSRSSETMLNICSGFSKNIAKRLWALVEDEYTDTFWPSNIEQFKSEYEKLLRVTMQMIFIDRAVNSGGANLSRKQMLSQWPGEDYNEQLAYYQTIVKTIKALKKERKNG